MRRLGDVVRTAQGLAVVRSPDETYADVGSSVVDEDLTTVGTVVDVFGPVDRPYLAVNPSASIHLPGLLGKTLYAR